MIINVDLDGVIAANGVQEDWWNPKHWAGLSLVEGAKDGLQELRNDGHRINIVTARAVHPNTYEWLATHDLAYDAVHHTKAKWNVPAHISLDDGKTFLNGYHERGLVAVKWRAPHNIDAFSKYEVDDWPSFVSLIRSGIRGKLRKSPRKLHRVGRAT